MHAVCLAWLSALLVAGPGAEVRDAERSVAESRALLERDPPSAWERARLALAASATFVAADFVRPGRRDEILEDQFLAARQEYRRHRAEVYAVAGAALARLGRHAEAVRYLRRARELGSAEGPSALASALAAAGREWEALAAVLDAVPGRALTAQETAQAGRLVDALGLASLQSEVDRVRLVAVRVEPVLGFRDGPFELPSRARLSTGAPLRLTGDPRPALVYVAETSCRTCTADLAALARLAPKGVRVIVAGARQDGDQALRQVLALYGYQWPVAMGMDAATVLSVVAPCAVYVARQGWAAGVAQPPLARTLPALMAAMARTDVTETLPRAGWSRVHPRRPPPPSRPDYHEGGLAPGEDEPIPAGFTRAERAYAAGRFGDALSELELLGRGGEAWLLLPELRLDQALCIAGLGRTDEARALLRGIGDSRFQVQVDRILERLGAARAGR